MNFTARSNPNFGVPYFNFPNNDSMTNKQNKIVRTKKITNGSVYIELQRNKNLQIVFSRGGSGKTSVCEILLENGADVDHADKEGKTALFAAASMGHQVLISI